MTLKIHEERNPRTGNQMTVVSNIKHNPQVIEKLASKLKSSCGAGGHVEGKSIAIQGSHTDKVKKILQKEGFDVNVK
ncbi:translation initiation factor [Rhodohalobacter sp. 614A]|uniref:translation initiation factor n=1 Tax=Rhodohalobacter sp. 614A TaxID=2908649 RepID=UPI001F3BB521|nr:translation initiation factor [Rhodohalobacter sp. 614A]